MPNRLLVCLGIHTISRILFPLVEPDFFIDEFTSEAKAAKAMRGFEAGRHRQTYFLKGGDGEPAPSEGTDLR